jgi:putative oxidoreductase
MSFTAKLRSLARDEFWRDIGLLALRLGFAGAVIWRHGYPKIPALLGNPDQFFDPIGIGGSASLALAAFAEVVCALAVALGWYSRWASLILTGNFVVIVLFLHQLQVPGDRGELALLYLIAFAGLFFTGPGRFSLDRRFRRG